MNENSPHKTQAVKSWLENAEKQLTGVGIGTARLDAELILSHTLRRPRTYLHAHPDTTLDARTLEIANARLDLRLERTPLAYITGHKQFYGRPFRVSTATLIPRPESEDCIDTVLSLLQTKKLPDPALIFDIGTGSGCLGITLALESPSSHITASDVSRQALTVAKKNADALQADVTFIEGSLLEPYGSLRAHCIVANLPYVDISWDRSPETNYEPASALFADKNGKALMYELIEQAPQHLHTGGYLVLEADPYQHPDLISRAQENSLTYVQANHYCIVFRLDSDRDTQA